MPPSFAQGGISAASTVLPAVYGYTSIATSIPSARARSSRSSVSAVCPQLRLPATLWCEIWTAAPDSAPIRSASSIAASTPSISSRMCVTYGIPCSAATFESSTSSSIGAYEPGV